MTVTARPRKNRKWIEYSIVGAYPDGERYGVYPDGSPRRLKSPLSTVSATERWAENKEKEMQRAWEENREHDFKSPTWEESRDDYMLHSKTKRNAEGTLDWKRHMLKHIDPHIPAELRIDKITDVHVDAIIRGVKGKEKSVNNVLDVFSGILRLAQKKRKLVHLPMIDKLKVPEQLPKYLPFEDYELYLDAGRALEHEGIWQPLAIGLLGADSGLRRGEMLALHQKSIDYAGKRIVVEFSRYKGEIIPTKGKRFRVVGLSEETARILRAHRHLQGPLVFYHQRKGWPMVPASSHVLYRWFDLACARAKLTPKGKLHVLRHTFGTHHAEAGTDMHRLQSLMGHSDQRTTELYARIAGRAAIEATSRLDEYRRQTKVRSQGGAKK